jgi:hypothetical protein
MEENASWRLADDARSAIKRAILAQHRVSPTICSHVRKDESVRSVKNDRKLLPKKNIENSVR